MLDAASSSSSRSLDCERLLRGCGWVNNLRQYVYLDGTPEDEAGGGQAKMTDGYLDFRLQLQRDGLERYLAHSMTRDSAELTLATRGLTSGSPLPALVRAF